MKTETKKSGSRRFRGSSQAARSAHDLVLALAVGMYLLVGVGILGGPLAAMCVGAAIVAALLSGGRARAWRSALRVSPAIIATRPDPTPARAV